MLWSVGQVLPSLVLLERKLQSAVVDGTYSTYASLSFVTPAHQHMMCSFFRIRPRRS